MVISNAEKLLISYGKKRIPLRELLTLLGDNAADPEAAFSDVEALVKCGLLRPVAAGGTNGNRKYPLFLRYHICAEKTLPEEIRGEMNLLHPMLQKTGYLELHPDKYLKFRTELQQLSRFLFSDGKREPVSRKERSFSIFYREKVMDQAEMKSLLKCLGITEGELCFYDTPEYCFHDYIRRRGDSLVLLICENKDVWFDLRQLMAEDGLFSIFGQKIDGVVYGEGNRVAERTGSLQEYVRFMGNPSVRFYYWGDIDREGFVIYERAVQANPDLSIALFTGGYRKMLKEAVKIGLDRMQKSASGRIEYQDVRGLFSEPLGGREEDLLQEALQQNLLIPQEIINAAILRRDAGYDEG